MDQKDKEGVAAYSELRKRIGGGQPQLTAKKKRNIKRREKKRGQTETDALLNIRRWV